MKNAKWFGFSLAAALCISGAAIAADAEAPPVADWTGFYIGAGFGGNYAFADGNSSIDAVVEGVPGYVNQQNDFGAAGWLGTVEAGYDYQIERAVFGVLANYNFNFGGGDASNSTEVGVSALDGYGVASSDAELGNSWDVGIRAGYLVTDSTLLFMSGGFTQAKFSAGASIDLYDSDDLFVAGVDAGGSEWLNGYFAGAGIETMVSENFSAKLEYRYSNYENVNFGGSVAGLNGDGLEVDGEIDPSVHSIRATLGYRF